jgi:hypothetical protein
MKEVFAFLFCIGIAGAALADGSYTFYNNIGTDEAMMTFHGTDAESLYKDMKTTVTENDANGVNVKMKAGTQYECYAITNHGQSTIDYACQLLFERQTGSVKNLGQVQSTTK